MTAAGHRRLHDIRIFMAGLDAQPSPRASWSRLISDEPVTPSTTTTIQQAEGQGAQRLVKFTPREWPDSHPRRSFGQRL